MQISNIVDISIKCQVSGQSASMVKGYIFIYSYSRCFLYLWRSIDRLLISEFSKTKQSTLRLKCTYYVFYFVEQISSTLPFRNAHFPNKINAIMIFLTMVPCFYWRILE